MRFIDKNKRIKSMRANYSHSNSQKFSTHHLYKRNHDLILLRFMDKKEAGKIMEDMHEGIFGTHSSGHTMAKKILRAGYYWSTMETDCHHHSRTCHKCQINVDKVHVPPIPLNIMTAPWPFAM